MQAWKFLILLVAVACLLDLGSPYLRPDKSSLTSLYNTRVVKAERFERPLLVGWLPFLKHSGVVVTTVKGERWLVHKGNEYGKASETVVVSAKYMSRAWKRTKSRRVYRSTVGDYVRAGGKRYNVIWDNCHHASKRMMKLP